MSYKSFFFGGGGSGSEKAAFRIQVRHDIHREDRSVLGGKKRAS